VNLPVKQLSGGEQARLRIAQMMLKDSQILILDEPTNDLDMDTLDMLEEMLTAYKGTLIIVSHDRDFLDQTVTKILAFEGDGKVEGVIGGYSDYLEKMKGKKEEKPVIFSSPKKEEKKAIVETPKPAVKKLTFKLQHELDTLPDKITEMETTIGHLTKTLQDADFYNRDTEGFITTTKALDALKSELARAESRWLELSSLQETL
jgi:ATP-binding cassette subfamily F protein uup